jgi:hypothetical protein
MRGVHIAKFNVVHIVRVVVGGTRLQDLCDDVVEDRLWGRILREEEGAKG